MAERASKISIKLTVNGKKHSVETYPMIRLLDVLRDELKLTGTKQGCGEGECGACSVLMNGELVNSCLVPALQADGAEILTIEGVAKGEVLNHIQESFAKHGGVQCGMCSPGFIIASVDLLKRKPHPTESEIRSGLSGNLCRCTGYSQIVDSVTKAVNETRGTR